MFEKYAKPLFWTFVVFLILAKCSYVLSQYLTMNTGIDGSYYLNVAQNIARYGRALSDASVFYQGLLYFPHPTTVYPLWPLVMSMFGESSVFVVGFFAPTLFYFASGYVYFVLGKKLRLFEPLKFGTLEIHSGHLLAFMLLTHRAFFEATSRPYTEGLAYLLLGSVSLLLLNFFNNPRRVFLNAFVSGILLALMFLTRSQLLVFIVLCFVVYLPIVGFRLGFKKTLLFGFGMASGLVLCFLPQYLYLKSMTDQPLRDFLYFGSHRESDWLPLLTTAHEVDGIWGYIKDRSEGLLVGYVEGAHYRNLHFHYLLFPLALFLLIARLPNLFFSRGQIRSLLEKHGFTLFLLVFALACFTLTHHVHMKFWERGGWYYAARHSIWMFLSVFFTYVYLIQVKNPWVNKILVFVFVASVIKIVDNASFFRSLRAIANPGKSVSFQNAQHLLQAISPVDTNKRIVVLTEEDFGKIMTAVTRGVAYHENFIVQDLSTLDLMLRKFELDYFLYRRDMIELFREKFPDSYAQCLSDKRIATIDGRDLYRVKKGCLRR